MAGDDTQHALPYPLSIRCPGAAGAVQAVHLPEALSLQPTTNRLSMTNYPKDPKTSFKKGFYNFVFKYVYLFGWV